MLHTRRVRQQPRGEFMKTFIASLVIVLAFSAATAVAHEVVVKPDMIPVDFHLPSRDRVPFTISRNGQTLLYASPYVTPDGIDVAAASTHVVMVAILPHPPSRQFPRELYRDANNIAFYYSPDTATVRLSLSTQLHPVRGKQYLCCVEIFEMHGNLLTPEDRFAIVAVLELNPKTGTVEVL